MAGHWSINKSNPYPALISVNWYFNKDMFISVKCISILEVPVSRWEDLLPALQRWSFQVQVWELQDTNHRSSFNDSLFPRDNSYTSKWCDLEFHLVKKRPIDLLAPFSTMPHIEEIFVEGQCSTSGTAWTNSAVHFYLVSRTSGDVEGRTDVAHRLPHLFKLQWDPRWDILPWRRTRSLLWKMCLNHCQNSNTQWEH